MRINEEGAGFDRVDNWWGWECIWSELVFCYCAVFCGGDVVCVGGLVLVYGGGISGGAKPEEGGSL